MVYVCTIGGSKTYFGLRLDILKVKVPTHNRFNTTILNWYRIESASWVVRSLNLLVVGRSSKGSIVVGG